MAYRSSPQDLFASEDSDSDATVDLSVPSGTEARQRNSENTSRCAKQNEQLRGLRRRPRHAISSSDSEDDSGHQTGSTRPSNECMLGHGSDDSAAVCANSDARKCRNENTTVSDVEKRAVPSQQPVIDLSDDRPLCKYGEKCYRKNPSHFQEFRHPGN